MPATHSRPRSPSSAASCSACSSSCPASSKITGFQGTVGYIAVERPAAAGSVVAALTIAGRARRRPGAAASACLHALGRARRWPCSRPGRRSLFHTYLEPLPAQHMVPVPQLLEERLDRRRHAGAWPPSAPGAISLDGSPPRLSPPRACRAALALGTVRRWTSRCGRWRSCPGSTGSRSRCSSPAWAGYAHLRQAPRRQAALAAGHDQPGAPAVDAADHLPRGAGDRRRRHPEPLDQPVVLRLDHDPDHRRPARRARHHRQGERAGARAAVRGAHLGAGVRPEAAAAAGDLRLRLLPLHLVDAAVHLRRAARRRGARGRSASTEQSLSREAFADQAGRVVGMAAETFNDGLRGYYFALRRRSAGSSRRSSSWSATVGVVYILYQREFGSEVLGVLDLALGAGTRLRRRAPGGRR